MTGRTSGQLYFEDDFGSFIEVGKFQEIEKLTATGKGGLEFYGYDALGTGIDVTGTAGDDFFSSFGADDIMRGGAGNDHFTAIGGHDTIISDSNDADQFTFSADYFYLVGQTDITGFNGAGTVEGDQLHFVNNPGDQAMLNVSTDRRQDDLRSYRRPSGQTPMSRSMRSGWWKASIISSPERCDSAHEVRWATAQPTAHP